MSETREMVTDESSRLRARHIRKAVPEHFDHCSCGYLWPCDAIRAADEIDRLATALLRAEEERGELSRAFERASGVAVGHAARAEQAESEVERLRGELEEIDCHPVHGNGDDVEMQRIARAALALQVRKGEA